MQESMKKLFLISWIHGFLMIRNAGKHEKALFNLLDSWLPYKKMAQRLLIYDIKLRWKLDPFHR